ncbi:hypothetical protein HYS93_01210 [Candidatus Daviesbacteria bacterium]|nr:hypothetical protein [Candidatus Daviesbacteria bacterium]
MSRLFSNQKGAVVQILILLLLILGISIGVYLTKQRTNLKPKATENGSVVFLDGREGNFISNTDNPTVWVRLYRPNLISGTSDNSGQSEQFLIKSVSAQNPTFSAEKCPNTINSSKFVIGQGMKVGLDIKYVAKDISQTNGSFFANLTKDQWNSSFKNITYKAVNVNNLSEMYTININDLDVNYYPWRKYWQPQKSGVYKIYAELIDKNNNTVSCVQPLHQMVVLPQPACVNIEGPDQVVEGTSNVYKMNFPAKTQLFSIVEDRAEGFEQRFNANPSLNWKYFFNHNWSAYKSGEVPIETPLSGLGVFRNNYRDGNFSIQTQWEAPTIAPLSCIDVNLRLVMNKDSYGKSASGNWIGLEAYSTDQSKVVCEKQVKVAQSIGTDCGRAPTPSATASPGTPNSLIKAILSDSPGFDKNKIEIPFSQDREYTEVQFTFSDAKPGPKYLYVQFNYSDDTARRGSPYPAMIYLTEKATGGNNPSFSPSVSASPSPEVCNKDYFNESVWTYLSDKDRCSGGYRIRTYECSGKRRVVRQADPNCKGGKL